MAGLGTAPRQIPPLRFQVFGKDLLRPARLMFIDSARILVKAGDGGRGCVAFRREKYVPRGGPSGGDGGHGGSIFLESSDQLNTLLQFRFKRIFKAGRGEHGQGSNCHGRRGEDLAIALPVGSIVRVEGVPEPWHEFLANGERLLVARGGRGGRGNARFATSTLQAPKFAEDGSPGEELTLIIELKLLADVGLVGFPNSGKSTLLSVISDARPKIADYPFTTLTPHLGVVALDEERTAVVADIPGLIEGAHHGKGLGDHFLRHIERTRLLLHLVDVSDGCADDPVTRLKAIERELALYNPELAGRPQVVVATKVDSAVQGRLLRKLQSHCRRRKLACLPISATTGKGIRALLHQVGDRLAALPRPLPGKPDGRAEEPEAGAPARVRPRISEPRTSGLAAGRPKGTDRSRNSEERRTRKRRAPASGIDQP